MTAKPGCRGRLKNNTGNCLTPATVERDGNRYCWRHDPARLEAEAKARREESLKRIAETERFHDARIARHNLEDAADVKKLTDEELHAAAALGGFRAMLELLHGADRAEVVRPLREAMGDEAFYKWYREPKEFVGGQTPAEIPIGVLMNVVYQLESGEPT